ncbi:ROK family transcriptional regulator [Methanoculleus taiwanensis]|uniref:ROK family transcriptional regulator n=1 Tax=Methanoculleus taiwanensis TaxID=1550565 RepID=A0A498H4V1_9EURY|nr:ROK family protein [Methanoculleus taiwanensis]RXE56804.1 ROK family transcriptional regulator [Methanoculleus taiwanensis]
MPNLIAVDLGGTQIRAGIVTENGRILEHARTPTPVVGQSGAVVTDALLGLIERLLRSPAGTEAAIAAVGISSAGPLDLTRGMMVHSPNIAFPEVALVEPVRERFGVPTFLVNDARAGLLGERWVGAARGCGNVVYVTMSTGIGGGAVVGGRLLLGRNGNAGEIGHLFVDNHYNQRCGCGHLGHWEAYGSGRFMPRFFAAWQESEGIGDAGFVADTPAAIFAAARAGEPVALAFMEALGRVNARGISNVIVAYNPEVIVFDGPIARYNGDLVIEHLMPFVDRYLALPRLVVSTFEGRAPLLGAAAYAWESL